MKAIKTEGTHDNTLTAMGLTMVAEYVRPGIVNPKTTAEINALQLCYKIALARNGKTINFKYSQGIAHHPNFINGQYSMFYWDKFAPLLERGKYKKADITKTTFVPALPLPAPLLTDIVYCLLVDISGDLYDFESWCSDYGYDTDSRQAHKIFTACQKQERKVRSLFTDSEITQLQELFQDY